MPKPLDPNSLRDTQETDHRARNPNDLTDHEKFVGKIKGMLVGTEYEYADEILRGILATTLRTGQVTENQRKAVENIYCSPGGGRRESRDSRRESGSFYQKTKRRWEER